MESALLSDLNNLGIKKYRFKKSYENLQEIKSKIISTYRDEIEWIEIESIGTKYIVRYEPRIKNKSEDKKTFRNIVAKKNAIIKSLNISSGQIVKGINSYVKKGDIIVSGYIDLNGNIKDTVSSNGIIYGETWYKVTINYPFKYEEVYETGKKNKVLVIKFLNKEIEIFNFNKFKTKKTIDNTILKNSILPIKLISQYQKETKVIKENNNEKQLIKRAFNMAKKKIEENLDSNESISNYKILYKIKYSDSVTLNIFFTVIEDITEYQEIEEYKEETIQE